MFFRLPAGRKFRDLVDEAREFSRQIIEKSNVSTWNGMRKNDMGIRQIFKDQNQLSGSGTENC